jgi:hypothetical protein
MTSSEARFGLHSLIASIETGCKVSGQSIDSFVPIALTSTIGDLPDVTISDSVCTFLTNGNNWKAIEALDFLKFEDMKNGGGLRLGAAVLNIGGALAALSSDRSLFCACWKCLVQLCHCVLPANKRFDEQLRYLCSDAVTSTLTPLQPQKSTGNTSGLDGLLSELVGNSDIVNGLLNGTGDPSQMDATKLISSVHRAVEPLIQNMEDGGAKQGIQMIVNGLLSLGGAMAQEMRPPDASTAQQSMFRG